MTLLQILIGVWAAGFLVTFGFAAYDVGVEGFDCTSKDSGARFLRIMVLSAVWPLAIVFGFCVFVGLISRQWGRS